MGRPRLAKKKKSKKTTIAVGWDIRDWLDNKGKRGESFDDIMRRILGL